MQPKWVVKKINHSYAPVLSISLMLVCCAAVLCGQQAQQESPPAQSHARQSPAGTNQAPAASGQSDAKPPAAKLSRVRQPK